MTEKIQHWSRGWIGDSFTVYNPPANRLNFDKSNKCLKRALAPAFS